MKQTLRKIFSPLLNIFEAGDEPYAYKPSHRKILITLGGMFSGLSLLVIYLAQGEDPTYYLPAAVFGCVGLTAIIIGSLGTDRAVAQIWGSR